jgi:hypothetical protein
MMKMLRVSGLALAMAGAGCMAHQTTNTASAQPSPPASAPEPVGQEGGRPMGMQPGTCPAEVPGTQVSATDVDGGEAVTFKTSPEQAAELRKRVHAMADMHNSHHQGGGMGHGGMPEGMHGGAMGPGSMGGGSDQMAMMPPPSRAAVEEAPGGARIVVTPNDPADLDRLRSAVRMHAEHMGQTHACGMDQHGM